MNESGIINANPDMNSAVGAFLDFLARDIVDHPERLMGLTSGLCARAQALIQGIDVDIDAPIEGDVAI